MSRAKRCLQGGQLYIAGHSLGEQWQTYLQRRQPVGILQSEASTHLRTARRRFEMEGHFADFIRFADLSMDTSK